MYCRHCGGSITENSKFCTHCGKSTILTDTQIEKSEFGVDKKTKEPYQRWSWGAFGLGWIYFAGMKYKYWGLLLILGLVVNAIFKSKDDNILILGLFIWLAMIIVFGVTGRKIAWESRKWKDKQEFIDTQKKWDIWGIILFVIIQAISFYIPMG